MEQKRSFWELARQWQNISHERVPLAKFAHNSPTYYDMNRTEILEYYFYWRSEVRNKRYPATDIGYILIHVYETIACIGFTAPGLALNHLIDIWARYRSTFSTLDRYLIPWIADFCHIYKLPFTPMDWYTRLTNVSNCTY